MTVLDTTVMDAVAACAAAAKKAAPALAAAPDEAVDAALGEMAARLSSARQTVLHANAEDVEAARRDGMSSGLLDRLRITEQRLVDMAEQLRLLAAAPHPVRETELGELPGGLRLLERRRP